MMLKWQASKGETKVGAAAEEKRQKRRAKTGEETGEEAGKEVELGTGEKQR